MSVQRLLFLFCYTLFIQVTSHAQNETGTAMDTTSVGYQIGYQIGSWLPLLIIITLALMVMYRARKLSKD